MQILDYDAIVYRSARKSYLQMLNPVQNLGLRLITGAFRTSPAESLQVETNQQPLSLRREKLCLQYITKLAANKLNPIFAKTFTPNLVRLFDAKQSTISTIGIRTLESIADIGFNYKGIAQCSVPRMPPWTLAEPDVTFSIGVHKKNTANTELLLNGFKEIETRHQCFDHIYTDGSKEGETVAAAMFTADCVIQKRLPDGCSIFTAELKAIQ